jgi:hypothetical protein
VATIRKPSVPSRDRRNISGSQVTAPCTGSTHSSSKRPQHHRLNRLWDWYAARTTCRLWNSGYSDGSCEGLLWLGTRSLERTECVSRRALGSLPSHVQYRSCLGSPPESAAGEAKSRGMTVGALLYLA